MLSAWHQATCTYISCTLHSWHILWFYSSVCGKQLISLSFTTAVKLGQGRPSPWDNDASPPFQIPSVSKTFSDSVINHKFRISPLFSLFQYISPISLCFKKYSFPPIFTNFPLFSENYLRVFYILYVFFVSPYFYHDAFMHHTMDVLEAPEHSIPSRALAQNGLKQASTETS